MITMEIHQEVAAQRRAFGDLVRRLDPDDVPASHAPGLWCELDQLGRQVAAAKAMVARRVDDSLAWKREGFASAAEYLAARGGTSLATAKAELDTSRALPALPAVRSAMVDGSLSPQGRGPAHREADGPVGAENHQPSETAEAVTRAAASALGGARSCQRGSRNRHIAVEGFPAERTAGTTAACDESST